MRSNLRDVIDQALGGQSPRARGAEKEQTALRWVYEWEWSSPSVLDALASPGRRGLAARLEKKGLVIAHDSPAGGGIKGAPAKVLTLSRDGRAEVESFLTEDELRDYRGNIKWQQLRHDHLVQQTTVRALHNGSVVDYLAPPRLAEKAVSGSKIPDAVWYLNNGKSCVIELEMTGKYKAPFYLFVKGVVGLLDRKEGPGYDMVSVISQSKSLLTRYKKALTSGHEMDKYERDDRSRWRRIPRERESYIVPQWVKGRIIFKGIEL